MLAQQTTNGLTDILNNLGLGNFASFGVIGLVVGGLLLWWFWRWFRD